MRLIAFGCSFTDYPWPTWADIIALDRDCEYENWGLGGAGNQCIARRILYRHSLGFDSEDLVMTQWTSPSREDRFIGRTWLAQGSVALAPAYGSKFVKQYWDWNNDVINTAQARITTELLLKNQLCYQMEMVWDDRTVLTDNTAITEYWRSRITETDILPAYVNTFGGRLKDGHPDPAWWLDWVETKIYPKLGWQLRDTTRSRVQEAQQVIEHLITKLGQVNRVREEATPALEKRGWRFNRKRAGTRGTMTEKLGETGLLLM